jgi:hypothetical protein
VDSDGDSGVDRDVDRDVTKELKHQVDTRNKIVDSREAAKIAAGGATVVSGYFDPMIAWHARWLVSFKKTARPLLVLIATPENPILPALARAELVASLRVVGHVAEYSGELAEAIAAAGGSVIHLENQDRELFKDLLELVHSRQDGNVAAQCSSTYSSTCSSTGSSTQTSDRS